MDQLHKPAREQGRNTQHEPLSPDQLDLLHEIESRDNIFAEIDYRVYCS
jgi:predicted glycosyl hydrolase (DUF1957 family)